MAFGAEGFCAGEDDGSVTLPDNVLSFYNGKSYIYCQKKELDGISIQRTVIIKHIYSSPQK